MTLKKVVDFNQYYTSKSVSELLSAFITLDNPKNCLELSAGEGALLDALQLRWNALHFTTVDIDSTNHSLLKQKFPLSEHYCTDATGVNCKDILSGRTFDLAVCNPPFEYITPNDNINFFIKSIFKDSFIGFKRIRAEVIFMAINIFHLKIGGMLAIIVPELIIKGLKYNSFRKELFSNYTVQSLVECKHKAFKHTEAKTYILFIKNERPCKDYYFDFVSVNNHAVIETVNKIASATVFSLDCLIKKNVSKKFEIIRGSLSGKSCKLLDDNYIHTTNMNSDMEDIYFSEDINNPDFKYAESGDILISRVGTRVLGKTNFLTNGKAVLSDCIFAIRFFNYEDKQVFLDFWNKNKEQWIGNNSSGTCARHITMTNLLKLIESLIE